MKRHKRNKIMIWMLNTLASIQDRLYPLLIDIFPSMSSYTLG